MKISSCWHPESRFSVLGFPPEIREWFLSPQSTTKLFNTLNSQPMEVRCLQQAWQVPLREESTRLALPPHQQVLLREVELLCEGEIWMYARATIPAETLVGKYHTLKHLGTRPLGEILFRDPLTTRSAFEIKLWQPDHFARRSIFLLDHKPLLLTEVFLPACAQRLTEYYAQ